MFITVVWIEDGTAEISLRSFSEQNERGREAVCFVEQPTTSSQWNRVSALTANEPTRTVVMAMDGQVQHIGVAIEHVLSAVAMVNVPINDQHAREAHLLDGCPRRHGHVVEVAEAPDG
jgi:hypothetical protein